MLRHALSLLVVLALGLAPARSSADVYRWVDEAGVTHYTTDLESIPRSQRDSARAVEGRPARVKVPHSRGPSPSPSPSRAAEPTEVAPIPSEPEGAAPESAQPSPDETAPALAPQASPPAATTPAPTTAPVFPGPPSAPALPPDDPRAAEVAELEARIAADREALRQMISTKRWDSAELASDPSIREIAERLPRLQAELAALRAEIVP